MTRPGLPVLALAGGLPAAAAGAAAVNPAADCAALWLGYGDYAGISAFLDGQQEAYDTAALFRSAAIRENGDAQAVDAHIAKVRHDMALMVEAHVELADPQSRDLFERFSQTCQDLADSLPEFQDPQ